MSAPSHRSGAALIAVMIVLLLCVALGTRLAMNVARGRTLASAQQRALQADWLAESGVRRAAAKLIDPNYMGEIWDITPETLDGTHAAVVTIRVTRPVESELQRHVVVEAEFPAGESHRVRRTRETDLQLVEQGEET